MNSYLVVSPLELTFRVPDSATVLKRWFFLEDMGDLPFERLKREILVRKEGVSSPKYGLDPQSRPMNVLIEWGIVNIDKPSGPSSHQVSAYVREVLGLKKTGHSGTLDPKVTGCLPVALERATRVVQSLLPAGKEYICLMHVHQEISLDHLSKVFLSLHSALFRGELLDFPNEGLQYFA